MRIRNNAIVFLLLFLFIEKYASRRHIIESVELHN